MPGVLVVADDAIQPLTRNMAFVAVLLAAIDELPDFGEIAAGYRHLLDGDYDIRVRRVKRFAASGADVVALTHPRVNAHSPDVVAWHLTSGDEL
jgi:hypothetical protein